MKSLEKKMSLLMYLALLIMIFIFLGSLIRLDCASAQGIGQGGQNLGFGGMGSLGGSGGFGSGAMVGLPGIGMIGSGLGMAGLGSPVITSPLGLGVSMGVPSSGSMLGAGPGIMGSTPMLGLGSINPLSMLPLPFYPLNTISPNLGQFMTIMDMGFMHIGIPPVMPFSQLYGGNLPIDYNGYYATSYGNELLQRLNNSTGITGVPYFYYAGGIVPSPLPEWVQRLQTGFLLPSEVRGYVFNEEEPPQPLEDVVVTLKYSIDQESYTTKADGLYLFSLFGGRYTFTFERDGYISQEVTIRFMGGSVVFVDDIFMEPIPTLNRAPVFTDMPSIGVMVGEEIILDPTLYASDPDGDDLDYSYSGWKEEYWNDNIQYVATEDDIGKHEVTITVEDDEFSVTQKIKIIVYYHTYDISLYLGFNLISYPFEDGDPNFTASDLMEKLGGTNQIDYIGYYDNPNDQDIWYDPIKDPQGSINFTIKIGRSYVIYANEDTKKTVFGRYTGEEQTLELFEGMNLIGIASYPEGYTSHDLLFDLGENDVENIYHYNAFWGEWESAYWLNGSPAGDEFPILMGDGYHIQMKTQKTLIFRRQ